jgi:putative MATE family efflux protein
MTTGNPAKQILNFAFPILIGNVFQQFYNMADTVIVGKFVGNSALAAVGSCGTLTFLILGFLMGLTAGFTVITAQHYGAGNMTNMRKSVASAAILSAIVSIVLTIASMAGMRNILHLMNTPDDMFDQAYAYIMVICAGIVAQVLYNLLSSVLRALGDSKHPLYFLILSALLNIVLDFVFIINFHMGTAGAAYATVISQGISGLLCLLYIAKKVPILHLKKEEWIPDGDLVKWQIKIGFPMAFQYSITAIGTIIVQRELNILGSVAVAGFTAAAKIEQIVTQAYVAIGTTMATYAAQNTGAGKIKRIQEGFRSAMNMSIVYAVLTGFLIFFCGKYMSVLFVSENLEQIMGYVDVYLKCASVFFIPLAAIYVYRNGLQGMGYGVLPMMGGVVELIGRTVVAMVASYFTSFFGICMAGPTAWFLAGVMFFVMYCVIIRKKLPRGGEPSKEVKIDGN